MVLPVYGSGRVTLRNAAFRAFGFCWSMASRQRNVVRADPAGHMQPQSHGDLEWSCAISRAPGSDIGAAFVDQLGIA